MKSIYLHEDLHLKLKFLASLKKQTLTELVEEYLDKALQKQMTDLPTEALEKLAMIGGSFDFLNEAAEDLYTKDDGEAI